MSLSILATELGFLKLLCGKTLIFVFDPTRKIRDTNEK